MSDFDGLLTTELDRWAQAGKTAALWLRDDDAIEPTPALDRLLEITARHAVPVTLAVIPAHTGQPLAARLDEVAHANVAVHGWAHVNHAAIDRKKQELGADRRLDVVLGELGTGFRHLQALHEARFTPVLVPPWNRIDADIVSHLAGLGFRALSVYGPEKQAPLHLINTHVDVMDWHGTRGGRDDDVLASEIVRRLQQMFDGGGTMGLLTHHLVHDEAVWAFLERLFTVTSRHPGCRWTALGDLVVSSPA